MLFSDGAPESAVRTVVTVVAHSKNSVFGHCIRTEVIFWRAVSRFRRRILIMSPWIGHLYPIDVNCVEVPWYQELDYRSEQVGDESLVFQ